MPLPSPFMVASPPLMYTFFDKTLGEFLSGGSVQFWKDPAWTIPKNVYQETRSPDGTITYSNLGNILTLSSIGTFVDDTGNNLVPFYWPYSSIPDASGQPTGGDLGDEELYFVAVYDSSDALQFSLDNWPPNALSGGNPSTESGSVNNVITNGQFSEVLFSSPTSYSVTGTMTLAVAPGWFISSTGTGTITVTQMALGISILTEAPYALEIQLTSGLNATLYQRIYSSPRIFADQAIAGYFLAACPDNQQVRLTLNYLPSAPPASGTQICTGLTTNTGEFTAIEGTASITAPTNTDMPPSGYVDISLQLQPNTTIQVTSFQVTDVIDLTVLPPYNQTSIPQQQSDLFWYWQPALNYKPIPSYLVGWDFPLNPTQFGVSGSVGALTGNNASTYIWDQTILFQNISNTLSYARNASTNGLSISTSGTTSFALVQYLDAAQAREILSQRNSVAIKGFVSTGTLTGTVSLYWTTAAFPNITAMNNYSCVESIDITTSRPTVPSTAGNWGAWTQVPNVALNNYGKITFTTTGAEYDFSGFDATASMGPTTASGFAIVVSFGSLLSTQVATFDYISLVGGDIATRPAPQTPDEVLRQCQYYWEQSANPGVTSFNTSAGQRVYPTNSMVSGTNTIFTFGSFCIPYLNIKRGIPTATFYSPVTGTANTIRVNTFSTGVAKDNYDAATSVWAISPSKTDITLLSNGVQTPASPAANGQPAGYQLLHITLDARIGVV